MTVLAMIEGVIRAAGLDGLCSADRECACLVGDLAPCGNIGPDCEAGRRVPCDDPETCTFGGGCDFHVVVEEGP